jgi:hypothetical protein
MAACKCGKCAACKKKAATKSPSFLKGKYTEAKDKKKDAQMTKGLTAAEKREFEKKDKAHGEKKKPLTMQQDKKIDAKIIKSIKKHSAHEKREGKSGEKRERSRSTKGKK